MEKKQERIYQITSYRKGKVEIVEYTKKSEFDEMCAALDSVKVDYETFEGIKNKGRKK